MNATACSSQPKQPVSLTMCTPKIMCICMLFRFVRACFLLRGSSDAVGLTESIQRTFPVVAAVPCVPKQTGRSLTYLCVSVPQTVISDLTERVFINFCQSQSTAARGSPSIQPEPNTLERYTSINVSAAGASLGPVVGEVAWCYMGRAHFCRGRVLDLHCGVQFATEGWAVTST